MRPGRLRSRGASRSRTGNSGSHHPSGYLVGFYGFEQRAEIALAESLVALPLDDLEEDRADDGLGEDLQQLVLVVVLVHALAVDEDLVALQAREVLAVVGHAGVDAIVVGVRRAEETDLARLQRLHGGVDVLAGERDVLDPFAVVDVEVFLDLRLLVRGLVDRDADPAA